MSAIAGGRFSAVFFTRRGSPAPQAHLVGLASSPGSDARLIK